MILHDTNRDFFNAEITEIGFFVFVFFGDGGGGSLV